MYEDAQVERDSQIGKEVDGEICIQRNRETEIRTRRRGHREAGS
jgi:hypothetical protein